MNTYIPDMKALWMAGKRHRLTAQHLHPARAQPVRDPLNWSKYIGEALYRFGSKPRSCSRHNHWPRWGNGRIQEVLRAQRDLYAN